MKILGIETSCDETAAAIIEAKQDDTQVELLSNVVSSSLSLHSKTGGIIPEIAAREQTKYIIPVIQQALKEANPYCIDIDAITVTIGPGLIGSLLVGIETAKTLAFAWNKPIVPVNHLIGHIYANWINSHPELHPKDDLAQRTTMLWMEPLADDSGSSSRRKEIADQVRNDKRIEFPALALIVSGGHTDLVLIKDHGKIHWLGGTRDDAAGEAFDKIGRLLKLPYPGGTAIEKAALEGDPKSFNFPRPMIDSNDLDFSFSGLKTAVLKKVKTMEQLNPLRPRSEASNKTIADIAASAQQAIIDVLIAKTLQAAQKNNIKSILLSGGVAANQKLRDQFKFKIENLKLKIKLFTPPKNLCTDNAAMIATVAFYNYQPTLWSKITANPELYFY